MYFVVDLNLEYDKNNVYNISDCLLIQRYALFRFFIDGSENTSPPPFVYDFSTKKFSQAIFY